MIPVLRFCVAPLVSVALLGCAPEEETTSAPGTNSPPTGMDGGGAAAGSPNQNTVMATVAATEGHEAAGTVRFIPATNGVRVVAELSGLAPGKHGFHIHESGDCSAPDASSAGGHFNPTGKPHGGPDTEDRHLGDLGNITANAAGEATLDKTFPRLELTGTHSIVGRAVIVHQGQDDLSSQPSGNAGARVGCGVITGNAGG